MPRMRIAIAVVLWIICIFLLIKWLPGVTDEIMGFNEDQKQTFEDVSAANKEQIETAAKLRQLKQEEDDVGTSGVALAKRPFQSAEQGVAAARAKLKSLGERHAAAPDAGTAGQ
jgi:hypothetical protein